MKSWFALCLAFCCLPVAAHAAIYSWTDAQGNVVYADHKPPPGVSYHTVQLHPLTTIPTEPAPPASAPAPPVTMDHGQKQAPHPVLRIRSPADGQAIRADGGQLRVVLQVEPALGPGQEIHLYLDGKQVHVGRTLDITLDALDRGEHRLYAVVTDATGRQIARSQGVTFYLLRHSILFKKPSLPPT